LTDGDGRLIGAPTDGPPGSADARPRHGTSLHQRHARHARAHQRAYAA
jgi:hypothetical protein